MFWSWHEFFIKSLIYVENYENGMPRASPRRNMILQHNKLTSGFRMTQRRAKLETCPFADKKYLIFAPSCAGRTYSEGLAGSVDESPFLGAANKTEFVYQSIDTLGSKEVGYFQMFGLDMQASESQLKLLKQERWINQGTSWYRLDFVVYNPNVALYCKINMKIIFDNTGLFIPSYDSYTLPAKGPRYYLSLAKEHRNFLQPLQSTGMLLSLTQLLFLLVSVFLWIAIISDGVRNNLVFSSTSITLSNGQLIDFDHVHEMYRAYNIFSGLHFLSASLKLLSFSRINLSTSVLFDVMLQSMGTLAQYIVLMLFLVIGFAEMSMILFGTSLQQFSTFGASFVNMFEMIRSGWSIFELMGVNPYSALVLCLPFLIIMFYMSFNIIVWLLLKSLEQVNKSRHEMQLSDLAEFANLPLSSQGEKERDVFSFAEIMAALRSRDVTALWMEALVDKYHGWVEERKEEEEEEEEEEEAALTRMLRQDMQGIADMQLKSQLRKEIEDKFDIFLEEIDML
ncbi:hypothetical protein GUITHDRAFT_166461 [Guillardia theta CCMP2712]|uniref:Polycystin cation channel PKD1/PKD2 domain-containing protein n=1 Tax=Guillardia theta (strain CCMP2712) TaxID=905079 RepID=L1IB25_GUITC|nr:hypothetical protein GUITHDRAFT_166461 [Guillardia theta CCMP2712]EKX33461.1 hypothetical protein GUITHDRAFT_166461 [Guillardia theta CCMP2712]|eukprot:XP_005820441.1 hypothetical protein GUITHDRAFT_166461 [Guillardia theta CCMP2712]